VRVSVCTPHNRLAKLASENWTAPLGSTTWQHHWPALSTPLATSIGQHHLPAAVVKNIRLCVTPSCLSALSSSSTCLEHVARGAVQWCRCSDQCRCVSADSQISADAQRHANIRAHINSQMLRSVQMLRSMCVGVSVCVRVGV
jgi:hypothetical protein